MHKQEAGALADGGRAKHTALQIRVVVLAFLAALLDGLDLHVRSRMIAHVLDE